MDGCQALDCEALSVVASCSQSIAFAMSTMAKSSPSSSHDSPPLLSEQYPVHSSWELTLSPTGIVKGRVYTTDQSSGCIVLLTGENNTMHLIQAQHVVQAKQQRGTPVVDMPPLPTKTSRKALEDRERKAIKLAEESLRHVNEQVNIRGRDGY